jgi:predicted permease
VRSIVHGAALDRELDEELAFHVEEAVRARIAAGQSPEAARRAALSALGGVERRKEECRDARGLSFVRDFTRDVAGGIRMLRRHPAFAGLTIAVLALGIGLNTAMFTVINAVLLQPVRLPDPDRIVLLSVSPKDFDFPNAGLEEQSYLDVRDGDHLLDGIATFSSRQAILTGAGEPTTIGLGSVTTQFFSVLGVRPALGRTFASDDDAATRDDVIVLSDWVWRTYLSARPDVIGQRIAIDGVSRRVVGVMPANPGPLLEYDAWIPVAIRVNPAFSQGRRVVGRLKKTTTIDQMRSELEALVEPAMAKTGASRSDWIATVVPVKKYLVGDVRFLLAVLACAVGFVLLIACSNVASLFLARTEGRARELAVRAALGAGRGRLVRQLVTESVVVSLAGGLVGFLLTLVSVPAILSIAEDGSLPLVSPVRVNLTVFAFTCGVSVLAGVLFGMAPALRSRRTINEVAAPGRAVTRPHDRLHGSLVIVEVALSVVLLSGAGLLAKSLFHMRAVDTGFPTRQLATLSMDLPASAYRSLEDLRTFQEEVVTRLAPVPLVQHAAAANFVPFDGEMFAGQYTLANGRQWPPDEMAYKVYVSLGYFETMGIRLRSGRLFTGQDRSGTPQVTIVSASVASEFWPGQSPIGQRISPEDHPFASDWLTIVGVVDDVKESSPREDRALAIYRPYAQATQATVVSQPSLGSHVVFVMRTTSDPHAATSVVREIVRSIDRNLPVRSLDSMEDLIGRTTATPLLQARLLGTFAGVGLLMTMVGIYGVLAYSVSQRTREFGIRMALGADRARLIRSVMRRAAILTLAGIFIGAIGGIGLTTILQGFLFGVAPTDPATLISVAVLLLVVCVLAAARPAMRASRVDPVSALRAD